jgi:hypothetical protein
MVGLESRNEGAADQRHLVLRLASLKEYLDKSEPIPFIVDDIPIRVDNEGAATALQVPAALSARTQVISFTRHRPLIELAQARVEPFALFKHALDGRVRKMQEGRRDKAQMKHPRLLPFGHNPFLGRIYPR